MEKDITKESTFVREPVDDVTNEILESPSQKFILIGKRGTGRSTILYNLENRGLGTREQTIKMNFDSSITFSKNPNEFYTEEVFLEYYELMICFQILFFLNRNYPLIYDKYFKETYQKLEGISSIFFSQINDGVYLSSDFLKSTLKNSDLSKQLLLKIKELLRIEKLNMAIDRFDWINGVSKTSQLILKEYFNLFNKVIIISDDRHLNSSMKAQDLDRKEYVIKRIDYSEKIEVVKMILKINNPGLEEFKDDFYEELINICKGNLKVMLAVFKRIQNPQELTKQNLKKLLLLIAKDDIKKQDYLDEISPQKRLYL